MSADGNQMAMIASSVFITPRDTRRMRRLRSPLRDRGAGKFLRRLRVLPSEPIVCDCIWSGHTVIQEYLDRLVPTTILKTHPGV